MRIHHWLAFLLSLVLALATVAGVCAQDEPDTAAARSVFGPNDAAFCERDVLPILKANCFKCHGGEPRVKGGLRLTSRSGILRGGDTGPAVTLETPSESSLIAAINYRELEMPPAGKLRPEQVSKLTR